MKRSVAVVLLATVLAGTSFAQDTMMMSGQREAGDAGAMMAKGGTVPFTTLEEARALAENGPTVLFFSADWCPLCRADLRELDERMSDLGDITVVIVNYDRAADLKRKYGVTYQHTYVQIDAEGEKLALWSGGGVDGILKHTMAEEER
jgi:thiol-disulfide isomerase/thioredoxin